MGEIINTQKMLIGKPEECLVDLGVDVRIILNWLSKE